MNHFDLVESFIELCHSKAWLVDPVATAFQAAIEELGFRHFACCSHVDPLDPPSHAIVLHNYPETWVRQYSKERLYRIDPVLQRAESHALPFFWDAAFSVQPLTAAQKRMLAEAATHGVAHGWTVPIDVTWIPRTLRASCSVVPASSTIDARSYTAVEIMSMYLYASVSRARLPRRPVVAGLTPRERESLSLAVAISSWRCLL